jgi:hypothetical protein
MNVLVPTPPNQKYKGNLLDFFLISNAKDGTIEHSENYELESYPVEHGFENAVLTRLTRMETKLDQTNGRVRELELWKAKATGFGAAVALGASLPSIVLSILIIVEKV